MELTCCHLIKSVRWDENMQKSTPNMIWGLFWHPKNYHWLSPTGIANLLITFFCMAGRKTAQNLGILLQTEHFKHVPDTPISSRIATNTLTPHLHPAWSPYSTLQSYTLAYCATTAPKHLLSELLVVNIYMYATIQSWMSSTHEPSSCVWSLPLSNYHLSTEVIFTTCDAHMWAMFHSTLY